MGKIRHFTARIMTSKGVIIEDYFTDSQLVVARDVAKAGHTLLSVAEYKAADWWMGWWFGRTYQIAFLRQMEFYVEVGDNVGTALTKAIAAEDNPAMRGRMAGVQEILMRGGTFSEAIDHLTWMDPIAAQVLRGADVTSSTAAIQAAITHLEAKSDGWKRFWPIIAVLLVDLTSVPPISALIDSQAIPFIRDQIVASKAAGVPEALAQLDYARMANMAVLIVGTLMVAVATGLLWFYTVVPQVRDAMNRVAEKVPLLRSYFLYAAAAATFGIIANMLRGGVPLYRCTQLAGSMKGFVGVQRYWQSIAHGLEQGTPFGDALRATPLVRDMEARLIAAAPTEKRIADVFERMAALRQSEAAVASRRVWQILIGVVIVHLSIAMTVGFWLYLIFSGVVDLSINALQGM